MSTCDCAERSHGGLVFTCPVCVEAVVRSAAYKALDMALANVYLDREGSVSASIRSEESLELPID